MTKQNTTHESFFTWSRFLHKLSFLHILAVTRRDHLFIFYSMASGNEGEVQPTTKIQFKHFNCEVEVPKDHHFIKSNKSRDNFNDTNASVYRKILKEWKILEKNLPESIYIHTYETRIDLLRAVIIGPAGTPYHDGLFFFDIVLPSDYPNQPPKVYYRSNGYRLNPNLYANGTVCLSLINTWGGATTEKWRKESTILQLLVSIQGLVLNERPYFNEPGYERGKNSESWKWIKPSLEYNEDVFVLSCKTMVQILKKPPENFESFVSQHFRERADSILEAIKAYEKGQVLVGQFGISAVSSSPQVSSRFKHNLKSVRSQLEKAFAMTKNESKDDIVNKKKRAGEKNEKNSKKGRHGESLSVSMKNQENGKKHGSWIWRKVADFVKWIFE